MQAIVSSVPIRNPPRPHATNLVDHPFLHPCMHCRMDFGGREMLHRHRKGRVPNKQCRTVEEMWELGWWMDRFGRWRQHEGHRRQYRP